MSESFLLGLTLAVPVLLGAGLAVIWTWGTLSRNSEKTLAKDE
jgi:hypothetical protein